MKRVFIDTGAWIALADKNDNLHKQALQIADTLKSQNTLLITSDYTVTASALLGFNDSAL